MPVLVQPPPVGEGLAAVSAPEPVRVLDHVRGEVLLPAVRLPALRTPEPGVRRGQGRDQAAQLRRVIKRYKLVLWRRW